ncbi:MAG: hypothetical protein ACE5HN_11600 [Nitrospiria bacterium]
MFTLAKKVALVGIGLSEQAKEVIGDLEKKGEESQHKDALSVKRFFDSAEKGERELCQKMEDLCKRVAGRIRFPTCPDIERLEKGLADLEAKFYRWEGSQAKKSKPSPS